MKETLEEKQMKIDRLAEEYDKNTEKIMYGVGIVFFLAMILPVPFEARLIIGVLGELLILSR